MGIEPKLYTAKVMHKRLFPKVNGFTYGTYYYALPLSALEKVPVTLNRPGWISFYERDHGPKDGSDLGEWARGLLEDYAIGKADGEIILIAMPRIFGYVFNPVSFWLCHDKHGGLRAVICEVNNTFGETHSYLCARGDRKAITREDWLQAEKLFHVSPFLEREGHYKFRFDVRDNKFGVWIDYYDRAGDKKLVTALTGKFEPLTRAAVRGAFWRYPLVTLKTISLIHWQAVKLIVKGIRHIRKPPQKEKRISAAANITKN